MTHWLDQLPAWALIGPLLIAVIALHVAEKRMGRKG